MDELKLIVGILHKYSIPIRCLCIFSETIILANSQGIELKIPFSVVNSADQKGLARLIMFSFDPDRANSQYWEYEDWDTLVLESEM